MANSVDPDQTDLGLHGLLRLVCPKIWDHYDDPRNLDSDYSSIIHLLDVLNVQSIFPGSYWSQNVFNHDLCMCCFPFFL